MSTRSREKASCLFNPGSIYPTPVFGILGGLQFSGESGFPASPSWQNPFMRPQTGVNRKLCCGKECHKRPLKRSRRPSPMFLAWDSQTSLSLSSCMCMSILVLQWESWPKCSGHGIIQWHTSLSNLTPLPKDSHPVYGHLQPWLS